MEDEAAGHSSPSLLDAEEPPSIPAPSEYDVWVDLSYLDEYVSPRRSALYLEISSDSENDVERELKASQELNRSLNEENDASIPDLDDIVESPEKKVALPEKDTTPVPEFDAIADLIPEKQRLFLKKHQKEGVAFMHKRLIAAPENERGCILAHSMGLGKTFQSIVFTRMFMWLGLGDTVLVIAPKSTLGTWEREFSMWSSTLRTRSGSGADGPNMKLYQLGEANTFHARQELVDEWQERGGVMVLSYQMFSSLIGESATEVTNAIQYYRKAFTRTATQPSLLICDEGHKIKNSESLYAKALGRIKTPHKIVLTGTPIQNNLGELYTVVNFVRPDFMTRDDFQRQYEHPIVAGSRRDSSQSDVRRMKEAAFALYRDIIDKYVHRRGPELLAAVLPHKYEFIVKVGMSKFQRQLYEKELKIGRVEETHLRGNLFTLVDALRKICNHTDLLLVPPTSADSAVAGTQPHQESDYRRLLPPDYEQFLLGEHGTKMQVLFDLLQQCFDADEKVLVFSQWTATLNLIEALFATQEFVINDEATMLQPNVHYYRLDGSTRRRQEVIDRFNNPRSPVRLFLISTLAGGVGISLVGATRAILYDVSWNPASDYQATCRCYRYGQDRPVFIYRLMNAGTVEESIWNRSCAKTWLSQRVVDQRAAERRLTKDDLLLFEPSNVDTMPLHKLRAQVKMDSVLEGLLHAYETIDNSPQITGIDEHDSLFSEDDRDILSERERSGFVQDLAYQRLLEQQRDVDLGTRDSHVGPLAPTRGGKGSGGGGGGGGGGGSKMPFRGGKLREIAQQHMIDKAKRSVNPTTLAKAHEAAVAQRNAQNRFKEMLQRAHMAAAVQAEQAKTDSVNDMLAAKRSERAELPQLFKLDSGKRQAQKDVDKIRTQEVDNLVKHVLNRDVTTTPLPSPSIPASSYSTSSVAPLRSSAHLTPLSRSTTSQTSYSTQLLSSSHRPLGAPVPTVIHPPPPGVILSEYLPSADEVRAAREKDAVRSKQVFGLSFKRQASDGVEPSAISSSPRKESKMHINLVRPPSVSPPQHPQPSSQMTSSNSVQQIVSAAPAIGRQPVAAPMPVLAPKPAPAAAIPTDLPPRPSVTATEKKSTVPIFTPQEQLKRSVAKYFANKFSTLVDRVSHEDLKQLNMQLTKQYITSHVATGHHEHLSVEQRAQLKQLANRALAPRGVGID